MDISIPGVAEKRLQTHADARGELTELFRASWYGGDEPFVQWNHVRSAARSLRGIHVHVKHSDLLYVVDGTMVLALKDLRRGSPAYLREQRLELSAKRLSGIYTPPGVAHAFWFPEPAQIVYSVTHYFQPEDELGFRWNDPECGLFDHGLDPVVSPRDAAAGSLREVLERLEPHQEKLRASW
jgi:dTDP-4-dehydrorhamnose 3,5-epimerase